MVALGRACAGTGVRGSWPTTVHAAIRSTPLDHVSLRKEGQGRTLLRNVRGYIAALQQVVSRTAQLSAAEGYQERNGRR